VCFPLKKYLYTEAETNVVSRSKMNEEFLKCVVKKQQCHRLETL